jgi:hypothetical protein
MNQTLRAASVRGDGFVRAGSRLCITVPYKYMYVKVSTPSLVPKATVLPCSMLGITPVLLYHDASSDVWDETWSVGRRRVDVS